METDRPLKRCSVLVYHYILAQHNTSTTQEEFAAQSNVFAMHVSEVQDCGATAGLSSCL